jgi:hypothetical protein
MTIKIQSVLSAVEDTGIKIAVYALAGGGKTTLCATAGESTIILSAESGLRTLKKYALEDPVKFKDIRVIKISTIDDLDEAYSLFANNLGENQICRWIMLDSATEIAEQILSKAKESSKDPRQAYGIMEDRVNSKFKKFRDLPGYNCMFTFKMDRIEDTDLGRTIYRPMMPGKRLPQQIPYLFDEVFALRVEKETNEKGDVVGQYRVLQTERDYNYDAKDRSGMLDQFEAPSIEAIVQKMDAGYQKLEEGFKGDLGEDQLYEAPAEVDVDAEEESGEEEGGEMTIDDVRAMDLETILAFCAENEIEIPDQAADQLGTIQDIVINTYWPDAAEAHEEETEEEETEEEEEQEEEETDDEQEDDEEEESEEDEDEQENEDENAEDEEEDLTLEDINKMEKKELLALAEEHEVEVPSNIKVSTPKLRKFLAEKFGLTE